MQLFCNVMQYFLAMIRYFRYFFSIRRDQEDYTSNYAFYAFLLALFFILSFVFLLV